MKEIVMLGLIVMSVIGSGLSCVRSKKGMDESDLSRKAQYDGRINDAFYYERNSSTYATQGWACSLGSYVLLSIALIIKFLS